MSKIIVLIGLIAFLALSANAQSSLPTNLNINMTKSSVSGLSSGAFMAVQMHVAYSSTFVGVGVFAGGPYNCAEGQEEKAETTCLTALPKGPDVSTLVSTTKSRGSLGTIDSVSGLTNARVYLFSGTEDYTVHQAVVTSCKDYYADFVVPSSTIVYENTLKASHTFPTDNPSAPTLCTVSESPYVARCSYDGAGIMFQQIYGTLKPRTPWTGNLTGQLIEFDQTAFGSSSAGMATTGYVYVPASCAAGAQCLIHVALHGCLQNADRIGTAFVAGAGYNQWADTNNIVVLYPQISTNGISSKNPDSCWDWWGYLPGDSATYDLKSGPQMSIIYKMMQTMSS